MPPSVSSILCANQGCNSCENYRSCFRQYFGRPSCASSRRAIGSVSPTSPRSTTPPVDRHERKRHDPGSRSRVAVKRDLILDGITTLGAEARNGRRPDVNPESRGGPRCRPPPPWRLPQPPPAHLVPARPTITVLGKPWLNSREHPGRIFEDGLRPAHRRRIMDLGKTGEAAVLLEKLVCQLRRIASVRVAIRLSVSPEHA